MRLATEEQKQRWLPQFCSGDLVTAIAMTEPGTGSDLQGIKTRAVKDGDHYILNGAKTFITNGIHSDLVIVVACTDPDKGALGFSLLVVERGVTGPRHERAMVVAASAGSGSGVAVAGAARSGRCRCCTSATTPIAAVTTIDTSAGAR